MSAPLRVLLVEDNPTDAKLVVQLLRATWDSLETRRVESLAEMREALQEPWDAILSDWSMPGFSALGALREMQSRRLDIPFLIVSGTIGEEALVDAMRAGARDYVLKDRLGRLPPALERELQEGRERARLRETQTRLQRLTESGIIGILTTDLNGRVLEANDAWLQLTGFRRDEVVGHEQEWIRAAVPSLRQTGVAPPWEAETLRKDGDLIPILAGAALLDGKKYVAFAADLTARKMAEAARLRAEEALRHSEAQLRQAQKMEAVGRLAGGVAHDFNNVLCVILSCAELTLQDLPEDHASREDVQEILNAGGRAATLTRQLLMLSRHQSGEPRVLDVFQLVSSLDGMMRRVLGKDVELHLEPPATPQRVCLDPGHLEQVVLNLVVNARDAMPGPGLLALSVAACQPAEIEGDWVALRVRDSGPGIPGEILSKIFDPFFTTKEPGKGTGLGLSTVFRIVQNGGGWVDVESEPGQGACFTIYLPAAKEQAEGVPRSETVAPTRGSETILLVEDEDAVRQAAFRILHRHGYRVLQAASGAEALALAESTRQPIDLLLTDLVLPGLNGLELAQTLGKQRPNMRLLCMSGYTDDNLTRYNVGELGRRLLQKPFTPALLLARLREVLQGPPSHVFWSPTQGGSRERGLPSPPHLPG